MKTGSGRRRRVSVLGGALAVLVTALATVLSACTPDSGHHDRPPPLPSHSSPPAPRPPAAPALDRPTLVDDVLSAARTATMAINSYDYRHLSDDLQLAQRYTTGKLHTDVGHTYDLLRAAAKRTKAVQAVTVDQVGLTMLGTKGVHAGVLVAGSLRTIRSDQSPAMRTFTEQLALTQEHGHWLVSKEDSPSGVSDPPPGNGPFTAAFTAAHKHLAIVFTYARKSFDSDFDHALAQTTGDAYQTMSERRDSIRAAMIKQQIDYTAQVSGLGVTSASAKGVRLLAVVALAPVFHGVKGPPQHKTLDVTLQRSGKTWLVGSFATLG